MQDEDAEALVVHVPTKGITALLRTDDTIRHVHGDEDEKLFGVRMKQEVQDRTSNLLGSPRLNFHGDRARHGPIDTCGVTGAEVNLDRGAPVEEGLPCRRAENILAVCVVRTHSP